MKATGKLLVLESQVDESKMAEEVVGKSIEQLKKKGRLQKSVSLDKLTSSAEKLAG